MSNTNSPFGFSWLGVGRGGGPATMSLVTRTIDKDDTSAVYRRDPMQNVNTGYITKGAAGVAVSQWAGIFWGCEYLSSSQGRKVFSTYWPGSDAAADVTAFLIPIIGAPPQLFKVQALLTNFTFADIGANCDIDMGTGTVAGGYGKSGASLSRATIHTTATLPFRIVDLYSSIAPKGANGTDDTSNYNVVIVQSNPMQETGIN